MKTKEKTRAQLVEELEKLKKRNTELESQIKMGKPGEWESIIKDHLLENSTDSIFLDDFDGNILYANETAARSIGYSRDELLSLNFRQLITPEYARNMKRHVKELLKKGYTTFESARYRKDGSVIPVEVYSRLIEKDGQRFIIHIDRDITERKQAEEALKESEERYRVLIENAEQTIAVRQDGMMKFANSKLKEMSGYTLEEINVTPFEKFIHPEDREFVTNQFARASGGEIPWGDYTFRIVTRDGKTKWLERHVTEIIWDGKPAALIFDSDITERMRIEEELKLKAQIVDNVYDSIAVRDSDGNYVYVNEMAYKSLGYTEKEFLTMNLRDILSHEYGDRFEEKVKEILKSKDREFEMVLERKDGTPVPVEARVRTVNLSGKQYTISVSHDITERKKAEEEIQFRVKLLDSANDSIFVHDLNGNLVYVNEAAYKSRGYSKEELMDAHAAKLGQEEYREIIKFRREEVLSQGYGLYETAHEKKDGSKIPLEIHARLIELGGQKYIVNAARDITERKRMEEALADEAVRRRILVEQSRDGIVILDQDGAVYEANRRFAEMIGYSQEEVSHLSVWDWEFQFPPEQVREMIRSVDESGDHFETVHRRKDGTTYDVEISTNAATYGGKKLIFCVCRDITERKRAEKEREHLLEDIQKINIRLEESNKGLQDFAYIASHDLREPLRKIISFGSLLEESLGEKLDEDERENFEFMMEGSNRMQTMIDDLLTYSRITTRAKPFEQVDLNEVIEDLKKLELAERLEATGGVITVPKSLPYVYGDQSQLHQLLQNLIGNGLKFHKDTIPPEIIIRAHNVDNNMLMIEIQDNGIGINERYKEQIFTMFKRLHSRAKYEGTGIGLAACKKIVTRHGGTIGVSSKPGEGSIFWFTLPRGSYVKD